MSNKTYMEIFVKFSTINTFCAFNTAYTSVNFYVLSIKYSGFGGVWYPSSRVQTRPKPSDF